MHPKTTAPFAVYWPSQHSARGLPQSTLGRFFSGLILSAAASRSFGTPTTSEARVIEALMSFILKDRCENLLLDALDPRRNAFVRIRAAQDAAISMLCDTLYCLCFSLLILMRDVFHCSIELIVTL